jgi:hypothetical protein
MKRFLLALAILALPVAALAQTKVNSPITVGPGLNASGASISTYLPQTCDGFSASDGAIASGMTAFSSASASFTAADVGKIISIAGAGATRFIRDATVVGGGAAHTVNEVIAITGGTGTAGSLVVKGETGGVITAAAGAAGALGKYTTIPADPVTAGDATFNLTFNRDNLVTTIVAVLGPTSVTVADAASETVVSAKWGYGSDYSTQINAALEEDTTVALPAGKCGIASTITVPQRSRFLGQGVSINQNAATMLLWLGAVDGKIISVDTGTAVPGITLGPFAVDGLCGASSGFYLRGIQNSTSPALTVYNVKDYAFYNGGSTDGLEDNYNNLWYQWTAQVANENCSTSAHAIYMQKGNPLDDGGVQHQTNSNAWFFPRMLTRNGDGIHVRQGQDNAFFKYQHFYGSGSNSGFGIFLGAASGTDIDTMAARNQTFYQAESKGGIYAQSGNINPSDRNWIFPVTTTSVSPVVTIEPGAKLFCTIATGSSNFCTQHGSFDAYSAGPLTVAAGPKMFGSGATFTATFGGRATFTANGTMELDTLSRSLQVSMRYGKMSDNGGVAPANGDAVPVSSTRCSGFVSLVDPPAVTFAIPFTLVCNITTLEQDVEYWFDMAGEVGGGGGNGSVKTFRMMANETP